MLALPEALSPAPPVSSEHVFEWLSGRRGTHAPSSIRKAGDS